MIVDTLFFFCHSIDMKIIQETPTMLSAKQSSYGNIILGIILIIVFTGLLFFPVQGRQNNLMWKSICGVFALAGVLAIVVAKSLSLIIDKTQNKMSLTSSGIFGKKAQEFALDQIAKVTIQERTSYTTNNQGTQANENYILVFYLKNGEGYPVQLNSLFSSISVNGLPIGTFFARNTIIHLGNKIAAFIGVPFEDQRPPTLTGIISSVTSGINQAINQNKPISEIPQQPIPIQVSQNTTTPQNSII